MFDKFFHFDCLDDVDGPFVHPRENNSHGEKRVVQFTLTKPNETSKRSLKFRSVFVVVVKVKLLKIFSIAHKKKDNVEIDKDMKDLLAMEEISVWESEFSFQISSSNFTARSTD